MNAARRRQHKPFGARTPRTAWFAEKTIYTLFLYRLHITFYILGALFINSQTQLLMNLGVIFGVLLIVGGIVLLSMSGDTRLVIRGTNIGYGWFLIVFGAIKLIGSAVKREE